MKKALIVCLFACGCCRIAYSAEKDREFERAILHGAEACFVLHVVDDAGQPVADANVHTLLGMNFREKAKFVDGCTDTNGELRIEGRTTGNEIEFQVSKNGYYNSSLTMSLITRPGNEKVRDGKWQPWGERRELRIRKLLDAKPILRSNRHFDVPLANVWLGLDMKYGDWVKPYGKGECADFELLVLWDSLPKPSSRDCTMAIRMCGDGCGKFVDKVIESEFPYARLAYTNDVFSVVAFEWKEREGGIHLRDRSFWKQCDFVFRTRCIKDKSGKIKESYYGCVRKLEVSPGDHGRPVLRIHSVFNPTPNDPNLEDAEIANRVRRRLEEAALREKARLTRERDKSPVWGGIRKLFGAP